MNKKIAIIDAEIVGKNKHRFPNLARMIDGKEYANQMRENAVIDKNGNIIVSEELWQQIANIIETQQAEIERLKRENKILSKNADNAFQDGLNEAQDLYAEQVENDVRAKAIREFAERLGEYIEYRYNENCDFVPYVKLSDIEKVVNEMVGADNESKCE